jgi:hypothetical protein
VGGGADGVGGLLMAILGQSLSGAQTPLAPGATQPAPGSQPRR